MENLKFIQLLPSMFWSENSRQDDHGNLFLEEFLSVLERILLESGQGKNKGVYEVLKHLADIFYPRFSFLFNNLYKSMPFLKLENVKEFLQYIPIVPKDISTQENSVHIQTKSFRKWLDDFLVWLAEWTALVLKEDWTLQKKREVISKIIPIYRMRGTRRGLEQYLNIYLDMQDVTISDKELFTLDPGDETSVLGGTTVVGAETSTYLFHLVIKKPKIFERKKATARNKIVQIIQKEQPVHTSCILYLEGIPEYNEEKTEEIIGFTERMLKTKYPEAEKFWEDSWIVKENDKLIYLMKKQENWEAYQENDDFSEIDKPIIVGEEKKS